MKWLKRILGWPTEPPLTHCPKDGTELQMHPDGGAGPACPTCYPHIFNNYKPN